MKDSLIFSFDVNILTLWSFMYHAYRYIDKKSLSVKAFLSIRSSIYDSFSEDENILVFAVFSFILDIWIFIFASTISFFWKLKREVIEVYFNNFRFMWRFQITVSTSFLFLNLSMANKCIRMTNKKISFIRKQEKP